MLPHAPGVKHVRGVEGGLGHSEAATSSEGRTLNALARPWIVVREGDLSPRGDL